MNELMDGTNIFMNATDDLIEVIYEKKPKQASTFAIQMCILKNINVSFSIERLSMKAL